MSSDCCLSWQPISGTFTSPVRNATLPLHQNYCAKQVCASSAMPWRPPMRDATFLGPWVRRFLLEHLVAERNLALNTQRSYRDMLTLLLPFLAKKLKKPVDRLTVVDLSPKLARLFL